MMYLLSSSAKYSVIRIEIFERAESRGYRKIKMKKKTVVSTSILFILTVISCIRKIMKARNH